MHAGKCNPLIFVRFCFVMVKGEQNVKVIRYIKFVAQLNSPRKDLIKIDLKKVEFKKQMMSSLAN